MAAIVRVNVVAATAADKESHFFMADLLLNIAYVCKQLLLFGARGC
jgi:hypothetical protein